MPKFPRRSKIVSSDLPLIAEALGLEIKDLIKTACKVQRQAEVTENYNRVAYRGR